MNRNEIVRRLADLLKKLRPDLKLENVSEGLSLRNDLGVDSITMLLLALSIEQEFSIRMENIRADQLTTVADVCACIEERLGE